MDVRRNREVCMQNLILLICGSILSLMFFVQDSFAHKVSTYAYREGDKVFGECYFVDGSPCKNSKVEVYNEKGQKILETSTDEKGKYSFATNEKGALKIVIPASEGHRAEYKLVDSGSWIADSEKKEKSQTKADSKVRSVSAGASEKVLTQDEIKQIVDEALDVRLQGLRTEIMDLRKQMDKVSLRDIIGGIGYIFGIWGIITLIKRRKNAS